MSAQCLTSNQIIEIQVLPLLFLKNQEKNQYPILQVSGLQTAIRKLWHSSVKTSLSYIKNLWKTFNAGKRTA